MRRSGINTILLHAEDFIARQSFRLPPFAFWTPSDWQSKGHECDEIRRKMLGWDITDFGGGRFDLSGLVLFTLRNGDSRDSQDPKCYAEKIMISREGQLIPMHFHWSKIEDIINRGGGNLLIELFNSTGDEKLDRETPLRVSTDGVTRTLPAGGQLTLRPGQSITVAQRVYHRFWGEPGKGAVLIGEVSSVNDDRTDNRFAEPTGRFPEIEEDEPPARYLCNEYPEPPQQGTPTAR